jgi:hypothetical protein
MESRTIMMELARVKQRCYQLLLPQLSDEILTLLAQDKAAPKAWRRAARSTRQSTGVSSSSSSVDSIAGSARAVCKGPSTVSRGELKVKRLHCAPFS